MIRNDNIKKKYLYTSIQSKWLVNENPGFIYLHFDSISMMKPCKPKKHIPRKVTSHWVISLCKSNFF